MKKYITTDKYVFGEGHIIQEPHYATVAELVLCPKDSEYVYSVARIHLEQLIAQGEAKELQEPKWTDDDVREIAKEAHSLHYRSNKIDTFREAVDEIIKQRS